MGGGEGIQKTYMKANASLFESIQEEIQ